MAALRIGIVDTGVNPWHSHVRGRIGGCRIFLGTDGRIREDGDFRDFIGHGTAVAGVIREALPEAEIFAVRAFDAAGVTYPSLVARGVLRAAAARCQFVNMSFAVAQGPGGDALAAACAAALDSGCVLVASAHPDRPGTLPASLPGVWAVTAEDALAFGQVRVSSRLQLAAPGRPRDLCCIAREENLWGPSFACARGLVHLARRKQARTPAGSRERRLA